MINFINKTDDDIEIILNNEKIVINAHNNYKYLNSDNKIAFTVFSKEDNKKSFGGKVAYVLFMCFVSLILFIFEFEETMYSGIENYIKLPLNVCLPNIDNNDVNIEIINSKKKYFYADIAANTEYETELVYDKNLIKKQVKEYHKEVILMFIIPILLIAVILVFIVLSKNAVNLIVGAIIIVIVYVVWYTNHKKNKKIIDDLLSKISDNK